MHGAPVLLIMRVRLSPQPGRWLLRTPLHPWGAREKDGGISCVLWLTSKPVDLFFFFFGGLPLGHVEKAFFPGLPWLLRFIEQTAPGAEPGAVGPERLVLAGIAVSNLAFVIAAVALYGLCTEVPSAYHLMCSDVHGPTVKLV